MPANLDREGWRVVVHVVIKSRTWLSNWTMTATIYCSFLFYLNPSWASLVAQMVKNHLQCRRPGFNPWIGKIPWRREQCHTPVFLPGEFHGLYSPWGSQRVEKDWVTFTHSNKWQGEQPWAWKAISQGGICCIWGIKRSLPWSELRARKSCSRWDCKSPPKPYHTKPCKSWNFQIFWPF